MLNFCLGYVGGGDFLIVWVFVVQDLKRSVREWGCLLKKDFLKEVLKDLSAISSEYLLTT